MQLTSIPTWAQLNVAIAPGGDEPRLGYNQTEAARILGVSRVTLGRLVKCGKVQPTEIGIYSIDELRRYLREDRVDRGAPKRTGRGRKAARRDLI